MKNQISILVWLASFSVFGLSVPGLCSDQSLACDILVPKLQGKNKEIMARTLQAKGYRVVESDLISANFDSSGPLARELSVNAIKPLQSGTLFLKIMGTVAHSVSTQPDTQAFLYVSTASESGLKILGASKYQPWIGSFSRDPQLFDLGKLPNCDEKIILEVANAKASAVIEASTPQRAVIVQRAGARINTSNHKPLVDPVRNEGSESTHGAATSAAK